jgi:hypothetical protein
MKEQLQARLESLRKEFEAGQTKLQELDRQQTYVRETLLRMSGAIQVLEEELGIRRQASSEQDGTHEAVTAAS